MTSSESEGQPPARKRSRTSANGDDLAGKKARGRPRVDTQDATAADRRRTQIRLAQRAYRQRKETTISSLKQENLQLQSIIEQMNKSFVHFNDLALNSGHLQGNSRLVNELKHVSDTFAILIKAATAEGSQDGEEDSPEAAVDSAIESQPPQDPIGTSPTSAHDAISTDVGWGYSATFMDTTPNNVPTPPPPHEGASSGVLIAPESDSAYELITQSRLAHPKQNRITMGQMFEQSRNHADTPQIIQGLPFGLADVMREQTPYHTPQVYNFNIPTPGVTPPTTRLSTPPHVQMSSLSTKTIESPWTYSHDESTFARRLNRAALEGGFHLLCSGNVRPSAINRVFRLSLPYTTLDGLRARFKEILSRGTNEDLDAMGTPFLHLGGAGTHYPRKDNNGNIVRIPNPWNVRSIGPFQSKRIRAENAADPSQSHDLNIDLSGFEGEWFDPWDVEGYLVEQKGCHINPRNSFAHVYVEIDEETNMTGLGSLTTLLYPSEVGMSDLDQAGSTRPPHLQPDLPAKKATPISMSNMESVFGPNGTFGLDMGNPNFAGGNNIGKPTAMDATAMFDQPLGLDLAAFGEMSNLGLDMMDTAMGGYPVVKQKQKQAAWVDVSKLIEELLKHGVCLGRAPGFRRKDVDMAFQASLIAAF